MWTTPRLRICMFPWLSCPSAAFKLTSSARISNCICTRVQLPWGQGILNIFPLVARLPRWRNPSRTLRSWLTTCLRELASSASRLRYLDKMLKLPAIDSTSHATLKDMKTGARNRAKVYGRRARERLSNRTDPNILAELLSEGEDSLQDIVAQILWAVGA